MNKENKTRHHQDMHHDHDHEHMNHGEHNHDHHDHSGHDGHHGHDGHGAHMMADFKQRFWVVLVLSIPLAIIAPMLMHLFGYHIDFPGQGLFILESAYQGRHRQKDLVVGLTKQDRM